MACTDGCGSLGAYAKILTEDSILTGDCPVATFDVNSTRHEFLTESIQYTDPTMGGTGLNGTIDPIFAHLRAGTRMVYGRYTTEVGPHDIQYWMPRILGKSGSSPFTTQETFDLVPFDMMINRDLGTHIYRHCAINRAMFSARASVSGSEQTMQMTLDVIGYEEHAATWPASPPALPTSDRLYWLLGDGALTLDTSNPAAQDEYYFDAFNLMFDNNLLPQTRNFLRITCLQSRGRKIRLQVPIPYTVASNSKLYDTKFDGAGVLNFLGTKNLTGLTGADYVTTFTFPQLHSTRQTPRVQGPGDIPLILDLQAYRTASEPITVTVAVA